MDITQLSGFIGDSTSFSVPLTWNGAAFTPADDWTLIFTAKYRSTDADADAVFQKASDAGISVTGSTATVATVPADTVALKSCVLHCDIQAQHLTTGEVRTVAYARLSLSRDVTRETTVSLPIYTTEEYVARGETGETGPAGATGATGATGPAGPAPSGTGFVKVSGGVLETPSATIAASVISDASTLAKAGKPSRLFNTIKRLATSRSGSKPLTLSTLKIGDSWALDIEDYLKGTIGSAGYLIGPTNAAITGATRTDGKSEYSKTPWGQSIVVDATGQYATWGTYSGGIASAGRFPASRFLTVHYEAINGGGSFKVQYESRTGTWTDVATIDTNNSGSSTYTVWESSALSGIETPRVRTVWVSGSSKIYAAGAAANSANDPAAGTGRSGAIICDVSFGGSTALQWDATPQAAWTALLGWLKTDIVFVRERRETEIGAWETAITSLVSKIWTARSTTDFVFIGSHPTGSESDDTATDSLLKSYCETNGHLFVDMRDFFPATYSASSAIGFQSVDAVHLSNEGGVFAKSVLWQHLAPIRNFVGEADSTKQNGPWWTSSGVQKQFSIQQDGNIEDAYFGTSWTHRGTVSPQPGIEWRFVKRDTTQVSEGMQVTYQTLPFWQMDSSCRHYFSSASANTLARTLGSVIEVNSGQEARTAMRVSGISGQTAPIFEVRTGAAYNASGTLVAGYRAAGTPFATLATYADNASALAGGLVASDLYKTATGEVRIVY